MNHVQNLHKNYVDSMSIKPITGSCPNLYKCTQKVQHKTKRLCLCFVNVGLSERTNWFEFRKR